MKNNERFRGVEIGDTIKLNDGKWCPVIGIYKEWFYVEHPGCKGVPLRYDGSNNAPHGYYGHLHAYTGKEMYTYNKWYQDGNNRYYQYLGEKYAPGVSGTDDISGSVYHVWREAGETKEILCDQENYSISLTRASIYPNFENMQPGDKAWSFHDGEIVVARVSCVSAGYLYPIGFANNNTCTIDGKASHNHSHPTYFIDIFQAKAYAGEFLFKGKIG